MSATSKVILASLAASASATAAVLLWVELLSRAAQVGWYVYKFDDVVPVSGGTKSLAMSLVAVAILAPLSWLSSKASDLPRFIVRMARVATRALIIGLGFWLALVASPLVELSIR